MLQEQALNIAQLVLLGVALGILIDIYRVLTRILNPGKYLAALYDLLFWLLCTLWAFVYLLRVNSGEARLHVLALLVAGFFLEQKVLGRSLRLNLRSVLRAVGKGISKAIRAISVFLDTVLNAITVPFRFLAQLVLRPIAWLLRVVLRPIILVLRRTKALFRALHMRLGLWWSGGEPKEF